MNSLYNIIIETFKLDEGFSLSDEMKYGEVLGWDSLGGITLIKTIEDRFSIEISLEEAAEIECIGDIQSLIDRKKGKAPNE